jgi:hypothetical protein
LASLPEDHELRLPPMYHGGPEQRLIVLELVANLIRRM